MIIRLATAADAKAVLDIYAPFITDTSLTFELEVPALEDFARRIEHYNEYAPWLVADEHGRVAGYAYASRHRERGGYQWSVECSIYMHPDFNGSGTAAKLYQALFKILQWQGFRNVYAVINLPNDRSVRFHEKLGFQYQFTFENVGYKLGKWKNVGWWLLNLNPYDNPPQMPHPFPEISNSIEVQKILAEHNS
ncbi:MAG: GNAT family N-acetyltransferase [Chitinophagaceae bacterium]|nr:GNAT family N-acetyltransferase [Chitinophagaceae bacterium]